MNKKFSVAILTPNFYMECKEVHGKDRIVYGGSERYIVDFCTMLQSQGIDVVLYQALSPSRDENGKIMHFGSLYKNFKGIKVVCLEDSSNWELGVNPSLNMTFNEVAAYADLRIYWDTRCAYPYALRPCISICHGIYWDYPHYPLNSLDPNNKASWMEKLLYGFNAPDVCVSVDSNSKKVISSMFPGKESRMQIIHNYVDTEKFKPDSTKHNGINVLYPRRLTMLRGCNEFILASKNYPMYQYMSVGQACDEAAENALKQSMQNNPHIKFCHYEMDGVEKAYQWADISVVPTKACEGLSLSLLESMACGLPVITTPVGGIGDAVIPNYNALIFDPQNEDLGQYIDFMAKDEGLRKTFGKRNREIAIESFDIKIWATKWMNLIKAFGWMPWMDA